MNVKKMILNKQRTVGLKIICLTLICGFIFAASAFAQTPEFTYQGKLSDAGTPAAAYDFEFRLCASETANCSPPLATVSQANVAPSSSGIFTVRVNFGYGPFNGADRFVEIAVRRAGETNYTTLAPRQKITSAPYAFQSYNAAYFNNMPLEDFILEGDPRLLPNYNVQNTTTLQPSVNFNIGGTGTASVLNATTQFNLNGARVLSNPGTRNLFAGVGAGASNTGSFNAFFGYNAGNANTFASGNSFFGNNAGLLTTTGDLNTFIGSGAGGANTTGTKNTVLGNSAGLAGASQTNSTAIGANAFVSQSDSLVLGSINGVNGSSNDTRVGIGTTAPSFKLQIVDPSNTGLRVQTNTTGGTVASFGGNGAFQVDTTSVTGGRFSILQNGNVGIGNNAPTFKFEVNDAGNTGLRVRTNTTGGTVASFGSNGAFQVDSTNVAGGRLTITQNGNVGIGDITPDAKLSVNGTGTSSTALEISIGAIKVTNAGVGTQTPVFIVERNASNTCGNWTVLDNPYSNNDPNAILFVTGVTPNRVPQTLALAVYYETDFETCPHFNNKWVVNSPYGGNGIPRFNVMVIKR